VVSWTAGFVAGGGVAGTLATLLGVVPKLLEPTDG
jgi:hypothetical protein